MSEDVMSEEDLALQMKAICDSRGREINVRESAKILHQLGKIYRDKNGGCDKTCLIQSATLFNAAILREPENLEEIEEDLRKLCSHILKISGAKKDEDLMKAADEFYEVAKCMRETAMKSLESLKNIPQELEAEELVKKEKEKITAIQVIQERATVDYKSLMRRISIFCRNLLGETKCQFALVAMGSVARHEVTPYSDFENIIVLQEGVQNQEKNSYNSILEHFRWFAVIFQIILINLGETTIPSVAIPCLNDFCTSGGDWFFDAYTPSGISFDGLMPHACKCPLGRPETEDKDAAELIKPVSEMARYLESEEDLKNGYHLADVLAKTCFIDGNEEVYDDFYVQVQQNTGRENLNMKKFQQDLDEDLQNFNTMKKLFDLYDAVTLNMKRVVYRSTTIFISALGRYHGIMSASCFDIISALREKRLITQESEHNLKYAVAVACEVRQKVYAKRQCQDDQIARINYMQVSPDENAELIDTVGKRSILDYFGIAMSLQDSMESLDVEEYIVHRFSHDYPARALICIALKLYEQAISLLQVNTDEDPNRYLMIVGYCFLRLKRFDKALLHYETALKLLDEDANFVIYNLARCKFQDPNRNHPTGGLRRILFEQKTDANRAYCMHYISSCLLNLKEYKGALEWEKYALHIRKSLSLEDEKDVGSSLNNIGGCLFELTNYKSAIIYHKQALGIQRRLTKNEAADSNFARTLHNIGSCYLKIGEGNEAFPYLEKSLEIRRKISANKSTDKDLALSLKNLAHCHMNLHRPHKSILINNEELDILLHIPQVVESSKHETSQADVESCILRLSKYAEVTSNLERARSIEKKITESDVVDQAEDKDVASSDNFISVIHTPDVEPILDFEDIEAVLKEIFNKVMTNEAIRKCANTNVALCTNNIAFGLHHCKMYEEAIQIYNLGIDNFKRIANENVGGFIGLTRSNTAESLFKLGRYDEAVEVSEEAIKIFAELAPEAHFPSKQPLGVVYKKASSHWEAAGNHKRAKQYAEISQRYMAGYNLQQKDDEQPYSTSSKRPRLS